jgi:hypothetical protein
MHEPSFTRRHFARWDAPTLRCCTREHLPCDRAGLAHPLVPACERKAAPGEDLSILVRRRDLSDLDALREHVELFGEQRAQAGVRALAHFHPLGQHEDAPVGVQLDIPLRG